jgi:phosphatidylethanolamine/phosphatidyl-N-methylethanolamine N-methyltransferase
MSPTDTASSPAAYSPAAEYRLWLREFARAPMKTGAILPSSRRLADRVASAIPERGDPVVVELGAGTGAITGQIQRRLLGRGRHLAIELNPQLAELISQRFPAVHTVTGDAADLPKILADNGLDSVDCVVSALPWSAFAEATQRAMLAGVAEVLTPTGAFTTALYLHARHIPPTVRFRRLLKAHFEEVLASRTIWNNVPPAYAYHARRPRRASRPG